MSRQIGALLFLCFLCETSFADTLVMKSGENKKGKILQETETSVLFNSEADGVVTEVPRSDISIVDLDPSQDSPAKKSFLNQFSTTPQKNHSRSLSISREEELPKDFKFPPVNSLKKGSPEQAAAYEGFIKMIEDWVRSHPEAEKYLQDWIQKFHGKDNELEKLAKVAKEA